jgi:hypothetical protein
MPLTAPQTLDMLGDLAAGNLDDVFSQTELDRFYARAGDDYNLAVYYGWRQIFAASTKWVDYQVAQTRVSRSQASGQIKEALKFWQDESKTAANQLRILGMRPVPTKHKQEPLEDGFDDRTKFFAKD